MKSLATVAMFVLALNMFCSNGQMMVPSEDEQILMAIAQDNNNPDAAALRYLLNNRNFNLFRTPIAMMPVQQPQPVVEVIPEVVEIPFGNSNNEYQMNNANIRFLNGRPYRVTMEQDNQQPQLPEPIHFFNGRPYLSSKQPQANQQPPPPPPSSSSSSSSSAAQTSAPQGKTPLKQLPPLQASM